MQRIDPPSLFPPPHGRFAHAVVQPAGSRLAFIAGQVSLDVGGRLVGEGDVVAQARQSFTNLRLVIEALGVTPQDVVQLTMYVVGYEPDLLAKIDAAGDEAFAADWPIAATTFLGVEKLGAPVFLFEVTAIVAVPAN